MTNSTKYRPVIQRVAEWNQVRWGTHESAYDNVLAMNLLTEELRELRKARYALDPVKGAIARLDAFGDVLFVVIGIMVKAKFPPKEAEEYLKGLDDPGSVELVDPIKAERGVIDGMIYGRNGFHVISECLFEVDNMRLTGRIPEILNIICDSNETKPKDKLKPNEKCPKGPNYVPPTEALMRFWKELNGCLGEVQ